MKLHHRPLGYYILPILTITMLITGCTTVTPGPPNTTIRPTPPTLADAWNTLEQRLLRLPTLAPGKSCPTTNDNVLPYFGFTNANAPIIAGYTDLPFVAVQTPVVGTTYNKDWFLQKVLWMIQKPYQGPVLIRGHQIDGPHALRFNGGLDQMNDNGNVSATPLLTELRLLGSDQYDSPAGWATYTRLQTPGCYIYQIDGSNFSGYFIFQAIFQH